MITLVIVGGMVYVAAKGDYRTTTVLAFVVLFILGADLTAMLRIWRTPQQQPPTPPSTAPTKEVESS